MQETLKALERAWARSDRLFDVIGREHLFDRGISLRHPFVFYIGHLPAFAWNHIGVGVLDEEPFDPELDALFARGIDPSDQTEAERLQPTRWPELDRVVAYRDGVRAAIRERWSLLPELAAADPLAGWVGPLVLEHELMHHETLLYMIRQLPIEHLVRPEVWRPAVPGPAPSFARERIEVDAGPVRLGADRSELGFGWDNEFPAEWVDVEAFTLDRCPVTVGDWLGFVRAGGYDVNELWDRPDWRWRSKIELRHPVGWREGSDGYEVRSVFAWHPADEVAGWPVYVSYAEAVAWCRWRGTRLPTEPELHRAAFTTPDGGQRAHPWGDGPVETEHGGLDFRVHGRVPVGLFPAARSAWGADDLVGNGWEWTSTRFAPREGFEAHLRTYPGYSSDFFDGRHFVVFGGSWATAARLLRRSFRNWYQRRYPWGMTTFRTAGTPAQSSSR